MVARPCARPRSRRDTYRLETGAPRSSGMGTGMAAHAAAAPYRCRAATRAVHEPRPHVARRHGMAALFGSGTPTHRSRTGYVRGGAWWIAVFWYARPTPYRCGAFRRSPVNSLEGPYRVSVGSAGSAPRPGCESLGSGIASIWRACGCVRSIRRPERYVWCMVAPVYVKNYIKYVFYLNMAAFHPRRHPRLGRPARGAGSGIKPD